MAQTDQLVTFQTSGSRFKGLIETTAAVSMRKHGNCQVLLFATPHRLSFALPQPGFPDMNQRTQDTQIGLLGRSVLLLVASS